ncbi:urease accessory protein UreE [Lutibaculum baratangense]|uniref:Urease accessory protein UreE n=1 Tax=Lutibaculum baratangense AMV1 TaxID=631454 RepID=V4RHP5_9HYPH|nr:urease accessory protein UreE [Lutibaculum baratangense]ESR24864.1 Urease accessory protein UreE [Lutibaculum baratangense AMV1]
MLRATRVLPSGSFEPPIDTVTLDHDGRHRRRMVLTGDHGTEFLLDLPEARALREGEGLELEDGRVILVCAAPEKLMEVTAGNRHALMRIVWHLGNRHLPVEIEVDRVRLRPDHVIEAMIVGLGGKVAHVEAPFHPETGAYHHHDHRHGAASSHPASARDGQHPQEAT